MANDFVFLRQGGSGTRLDADSVDPPLQAFKRVPKQCYAKVQWPTSCLLKTGFPSAPKNRRFLTLPLKGKTQNPPRDPSGTPEACLVARRARGPRLKGLRRRQELWWRPIGVLFGLVCSRNRWPWFRVVLLQNRVSRLARLSWHAPYLRFRQAQSNGKDTGSIFFCFLLF